VKLSTSFDYPPIPIRSFDWSCIDSDTFDADWDGEQYVTTCPIGRGPTEEAAIIDFVQQLCEKEGVEWLTEN
jgi:hypothetical protein